MKRPFLVIGLVLLIFASVAFAQTGKTPEATSGTSQAQTCTPSMCDLVGQILDEVQILNNNKAGEIVTGYAVLKDGNPSTSQFWLPMPVGTCRVTVVSQAQGQHTIRSQEARDAGASRNDQICDSQGNSWAQCTHTMTFDEDIHFYHASGSADFSYFQVAYKCTLA